MDSNVLVGFTYVIIAGIFSGSFAIPMKITKKWKWENVWLMFSIWALFVSPWLVASFTIHHVLDIYRSAPAGEILLVLVFGLAWGIGGVTFGKGLDYLGLALGMAIMMGLINAIGTMVPIVVLQPELLGTTKGMYIISGVLILTIGIIVLSVAGKKREESQKKNENIIKNGNPGTKKSFVAGLIIAIIAGVFGPMINFAFVFSDEIQQLAIHQGTQPENAGNAIWPLTFLSGGLINAGYCIFLLKKNKTVKLFRDGNAIYWISTLLMGVVWFGSIMFFGMAAKNLGVLGASVGWASFQALAIITSNIIGLIVGEWRGTSLRIKSLLFAGICILIVGIIIIGMQK